MRVLVLPGDGIGPEISTATVEMLNLVDRRLSLALRLETHEVGLTRLNHDGTTLPPAVLQAARAGHRRRTNFQLGLSATRARRHQHFGRAENRARSLRQH